MPRWGRLLTIYGMGFVVGMVGALTGVPFFLLIPVGLFMGIFWKQLTFCRDC